LCKVVNKYKEPYTVYIDRGSKWGNPYSHLDGTKAKYKVNSREEAIESYRSWLWNEIKLGNITKEDLLSLDGQVLGCYCKPKSCHGDVLVNAVKWVKG
jgi:hypothetical protein